MPSYSPKSLQQLTSLALEGICLSYGQIISLANFHKGRHMIKTLLFCAIIVILLQAWIILKMFRHAKRLTEQLSGSKKWMESHRQTIDELRGVLGREEAFESLPPGIYQVASKIFARDDEYVHLLINCEQKRYYLAYGEKKTRAFVIVRRVPTGRHQSERFSTRQMASCLLSAADSLEEAERIMVKKLD